MSGLSMMSHRDRDEETTPPKAKKFKQNEISSSYSSSKESGKWSVIKPTKSITSGVKDVDIEGSSLKRKYQRSASDSDDNEEDSRENINSIGCQTLHPPDKDAVSRSSVKRPNTNTTSEESSIESSSLVAASDKENEEDDIVIDEEDLRRRREKQMELFPSCVPLQYFSLDDHLRDERRKSKRLNRLLSAVRRGVEEEQAKKVSPEKPNLSAAVSVTSTPVTVPSLPSGNVTPISSLPTVTSTATTVVNSVPSSIPSVVPISSNPLLTVTPIQPEEKKGNLVSSASTVTGITPAASFTLPSNPSPSFNFPPPVPSVTPGMTASSVQTSQQMNNLQAIAGNFNYSQTNQPIVGGNSLFNIGVTTKKSSSSSSTSRRRRK